jgi:hypothetical protein
VLHRSNGERVDVRLRTAAFGHWCDIAAIPAGFNRNLPPDVWATAMIQSVQVEFIDPM